MIVLGPAFLTYFMIRAQGTDMRRIKKEKRLVFVFEMS